jgi:hypothetical protein
MLSNIIFEALFKSSPLYYILSDPILAPQIFSQCILTKLNMNKLYPDDEIHLQFVVKSKLLIHHILDHGLK